MKLLPAHIPASVTGAASTALLAVAIQAQTVVFSDGDFSPTDWTATSISNTFSGGASFTAGRQLAGGAPGAFWRTTHTYNGLGAIIVSHSRAGAVYDPSTQGPIRSLDYSWDLNHINSLGNNEVAYRLMVVQNGVFYNTSNDIPLSPNWTPFDRRGIRAEDLLLVVGEGPLHPDFSHHGAPIQFGFITANSSPRLGSQAFRNHGIDNWRVEVMPGDPAITTMPPLPDGLIQTDYQAQLAAIGP